MTVALPDPVAVRFTVSVLDSNFVEVIVGALRRATRPTVQTVTGDISTLVTGALGDVVGYVRDVVADAAAGGRHVSVGLSLTSQDVPDRAATTAPAPVGLRARAHWSLPGDAAASVARSMGTHSGDEPFVTRLDGDLADVLHTVAEGWLLAGEDGRPAVTYATIALNSPSEIREDA